MDEKIYSEDITVAASQNIKERDYWLAKLSGELTSTYFPYDRNRPAPVGYTLERVKQKYPERLFSKLIRLSNGMDYSLHVIFVAGVVLLLGKYTGNKDIIVGTPIYKQEQEGEFINTVLALRNRLDRHMTFKQLLLQVKQTVVEATENQNYPFETLVYKLDLEFNRTDFPLFDVAVLLKNIHDKKYLHPIEPNILFSFARNDRSVEIEVEYNSVPYEKSTIQRLVTHLNHLLQTAIFNSGIPVADIDILSREEKEQLLVNFNDNDTDFPRDKTLHHFLERQAEVNPQGTAITYNDEQLTYGELNRRVNQLVPMLREKGIYPGKFVGVLLKRSPLMVVNILAIWKTGGAYIPIDPGAPPNRVRYMLDDGQISVLLTGSKDTAAFSYTDILGFQLETKGVNRTAVRPQITKFDEIPFPDRSLVNYEKYSQYIGQAIGKNSISLQATRGCPYQCAYCHKIWPKKHVARSAENIFAEVQLYYKMGVKRFAVIDDIFNFDRSNSSRFFELIIKNGLDVHLFFPNGVRGDILTKEYIDLMVEAGTVNVALALETASPRLQKLIGKNLHLEKLRENIEYFCHQYPHVILELFTMHGFPTETEEEAMMTMNFIKNSKWIHFPYIEILKIFANTDMEKLAIENGVSPDAIARSEKLAFHELPDTLPFDKHITRKYQSDYLNEYFLSKERLRHVLPHQMKVLTEDEIAAKYDSYLPMEIRSIADLLELAGIKPGELKADTCLQPRSVIVPNLHEKMKQLFPVKTPDDSALRVLLLDMSQSFSKDSHQLNLMVEPPLGLMYLLTYLHQQFGSQINGKIAKSLVDFDSYEELKQLLTEFQPQVIGIRTLTYYKDFFHEAAAVIKQWGFDVPIIAGGPYATSAYNKILQDKNIDLVVIGEGEITFAEVIQKIIENNKEFPSDRILQEIPGIAFVPGKKDMERSRSWDIILLEQLQDMISSEPGENTTHPRAGDMNNIAYAIYTSGSTGNPKGAMVEHMGMMNHIHAKINDLGLTPGSIIAQNASHCFDISVWQFFTTLVLGGKTVIYPEDCILEPEQFLAKLIRHQVNILEVVPSYLSVLLSILDMEFKPMPSLEYLLVTGETLKPALVQRWFEKYPGIKMVNAYGPTEASDDITHCIMEQAPLNHRITIGKSLQNMKIYIVDEHMKLCPIGVKGEIVVSGTGVGRGYLNDPEKTHWAFMKDPFMEKNGRSTRLYKTGDLGRWQTDGTIEFLGRKDHQIKIRGIRIELEEIERHLAELTEVREAVVTDREDKQAGKYLCAYIVLSQPEKNILNVPELREYLKNRLPDAMIPAYFVPLAAIPLTLNGKVNRNALPEPETLLPGEEYAPSGNQTEQVLTEIWAEILKIEKDRISIYGNFFQLGGHSLTATILIAQMHKRLDVKVPLTEVFKTPTIRGLASYIIGARKRPYQAIELAGKKDYYALSSAQRRLYFFQQIEPENTVLNTVGVLPLKGQLNLARVEETFKKMINRHESLRTSFVLTGEGPAQKIHEEVEFAIRYYNWTTGQWAPKMKNENENNQLNGPGSEVDDQVLRKIIDDFQQPFDLSKAPLFRVGIVNIHQKKQFFFVDINHIISDGTSEDIFVKDFIALYQGEKLPPLKLTYKDYSEWQNSEKTKKLLKKQETYWLKQFEGEIPIQELPTDYERPEIHSFTGAHWEFGLDSQKTVLLKKMALELDVTLFMVLLAAYNVLLYKLNGQEDVIVGTPTAGRNHPDLRDIIGIFINVLALRNSYKDNKTFKEFLETVGERTLPAFENQDYLFDHLVEKLFKNRDTRHNPLFKTVIILQNVQGELPGMKTTEKYNVGPFERVSTSSDLALFISEEADGSLFFSFVYCLRLFKQTTIQQFSRIFKQILTQAAENPDILLAEIKTENLPPKKAKRTDATPEIQLEHMLKERKLMSPEDLENAFTQISWHYRINQQYLYSQVNKTDWGIMAYSNMNAEPLWNQAVFTSTLTGCSPGEISRYLQEIKDFYTEHRRYPTLYVMLESPDFNILDDNLRKNNFRVYYVDTWQIYNLNKCELGAHYQPNCPLTIKPVETEREMDVFIDLLSQIYLLNQVYTGNFLKSTFCAERGKYLKNYIGYDNGTPVCVASLLKEDKYAYALDLGTLKQHRGKGYGKRMVLHQLSEGKRLGAGFMFQQARFGMNAEQMYEELGAESKFHRVFYVLYDTTFPVSRGEVFWKNHLSGFKNPTVLPMKPISADRNPLPGDRIWASEKIELSERLKNQLENFAAKEHLNTNTLVIAAWLLLLSHYCHTESVLFGIGLARNDYLPMGVAVRTQEDLLSWLRHIQNITDNIRSYRKFPLIEIHEWSDIPNGQQLFQHVLEFLEPMDTQTWNPRQYLYSLVCKIITPIQRIEIQYDTDYYDNGFISGLIDHWLRLVEGIINTVLLDRNSQVKNIGVAHHFMEVKSSIITEEQGDFDF